MVTGTSCAQDNVEEPGVTSARDKIFGSSDIVGGVRDRVNRPAQFLETFFFGKMDWSMNSGRRRARDYKSDFKHPLQKWKTIWAIYKTEPFACIFSIVNCPNFV